MLADAHQSQGPEAMMSPRRAVRRRPVDIHLMAVLAQLAKPHGFSQRTGSERKSHSRLPGLNCSDLRYATAYSLVGGYHPRSSKHGHGSRVWSKDGQRPQHYEHHLSIGSAGHHPACYADCSLGMVCASGPYGAMFGIHQWSAHRCRKGCSRVAPSTMA